MFEWLENELQEIKTNKFHVVDGPADKKLRRAIETTKLAAPRVYKDFALRFGNAKLFREDDAVSRYHLVVLASMRDEEDNNGIPLCWIGAFAGRLAYFKQDLLDGENDSPVFEWVVGPYSHLQQAADGFAAWFDRRSQNARKKYKKRRWAEILRGPEPFTAREQKIVEARSKFRWRVIGIAKNRDLRFEVENNSSIVLPYLSIGVDDAAQSLGGEIFLPVSHIRPGQTKIVEFNCYKATRSPDKLVPFDFPAPGPEDRERYAEFEDI